MKQTVIRVTAVFAIIILGVSAWLYGYHHHKSTDNLPNLTSIAAMDEADVNELLAGYRKVQLRTIWKEPDETTTNEDLWVINETTTLIVSYNHRDKVVVCGFSTEEMKKHPD